MDADTKVNEAVVRAALREMDDGVVGGGAGVRFEGAPKWVDAFMLAFVPAFRLARLAAGCFVFCRRDAFEAVGGFDETVFAGEEIVLSRALKRRGPFVILRESVLTSPRKLENRSFWTMLRITAKLAVNGGIGGVKRREHAGFWYEEER